MRSRTAGATALALVLISCAGEESAPTTPAPTESTTVVETTVITPEPTTTTEATTTTGATATTTLLVSSTTITLPPFPPGRTELEHGGDTWAVVLAASEDIDSTELLTAESAAQDAGYVTGATDCDFGAATILGRPEEDGHFYTVSVYFNTENDADSALEAFRARGVEGAVGVVQTFCLD
jgi:hypothetical protein